jgi:predicted metal-dependent HD superfamily phosphohydrolase
MSDLFDEQGFASVAGRVRWQDVVAVGIRTTPDGPFAEDLFWQFLVPGGVLDLPGMLVDGAALEVMQRALPGLDSLKIVAAAGSTEHRTFRVWHREDSRAPWDDAACLARFAGLVGRLGGDPACAGEVFSRLRAAWGDATRRYHDLEHLADCLRELDGARGDAGGPAAVDVAELALWFHDAIYQPRARGCEARSATLLIEEGATLAIPRAALLAAADCVRATAHTPGAASAGPVADLVIDIDLSILGRDPFRFLEYEHAVAEEYAGVSATLYRLVRGRLLAGLLAAPALFRTERFRARYEATARANVAALLRSPRYRVHRWLGWLYRWLV